MRRLQVSGGFSRMSMYRVLRDHNLLLGGDPIGIAELIADENADKQGAM